MRIDVTKGTPALSMINGPRPKEQEVTILSALLLASTARRMRFRVRWF
jgi:hypothetical protein